MSEETRIVRVTKDPGLLLGHVWVPLGKTAVIDRTRADSLIRDQLCSKADGETPDFTDLYPQPTPEQIEAQVTAEEAYRNTDASQLSNWPAYPKLNAGGLTTVEQLQTYIAENGTLWATRIELTDEEVVAVEAQLKKLTTKTAAAKPAAKPTAAKPAAQPVATE